ncbi:hypothetical protein D018_0046A, partial [Vibrio parahaemolyticus VP2007-007]
MRFNASTQSGFSDADSGSVEATGRFFQITNAIAEVRIHKPAKTKVSVCQSLSTPFCCAGAAFETV